VVLFGFSFVDREMAQLLLSQYSVTFEQKLSADGVPEQVCQLAFDNCRWLWTATTEQPPLARWANAWQDCENVLSLMATCPVRRVPHSEFLTSCSCDKQGAAR
jgi:hypothetical protein